MKSIWKKILAGAAALAMLGSTAALAETPNIICHKANGITIDGDLSDWNLDSPAVVKDAEQIIRDGVFWKGQEDCSMTVYTAYDEEYLYIAWDVTEDTIYGASESLEVDGQDNLKLYISTDPNADVTRTKYTTNDFLVYTVMDKEEFYTAVDRSMITKDERQRFVSKGMGGAENTIDGYLTGTQQTETGFIFECAIPWSFFSNKNIAVYVPASGDTLAVDFVITDIGYVCPGNAYIPQLAWTGTYEINSNPSLWGSMTLE